MKTSFWPSLRVMIVNISLLGLLCRSAVAFHPTLSSVTSRRSVTHNSHWCYTTKVVATVSSNLKAGNVVVVGSINQDLTTYAPSLPSPVQTILGLDFATAAGGKAANQAATTLAIGAVGKKRGVHMVGRIGDDAIGKSLPLSLCSKGIRLNKNKTKGEGVHTSVVTIVVDLTTGQNTIVVAPGANMEFSTGCLVGRSERQGEWGRGPGAAQNQDGDFPRSIVTRYVPRSAHHSQSGASAKGMGARRRVVLLHRRVGT